MKKKVYIISFLLISLCPYINLKGQELIDLTENEKKAILDRHNFYRNEVNSDSLNWSEKLADLSAEWALQLANKKQFKHKPNNPYGENLFLISIRTTDGTIAVDDWAKEQKYMNKRTKISNSNYGKIGHYTQIVWYNTTEVGCAAAIDKNGYTYWVCTYNPGGNYIGESPFNKD